MNKVVQLVSTLHHDSVFALEFRQRFMRNQMCTPPKLEQCTLLHMDRQFKKANPSTVRFLGGGRKAAHLEETHVVAGRTCETLCRQQSESGSNQGPGRQQRDPLHHQATHLLYILFQDEIFVVPMGFFFTSFFVVETIY